MSGSAPRVSVLVPVYNALPWLPISVDSVLAQTFADWELLLVDDGSTDGSGDVCDGYAARDPRVRVLRHPGGANRGQVPSMNMGLAEARAAYVARLDADDMMYPERLEKQVVYLDAHPEVALVGSQVDWASPWGTSRWKTPTDPHVARWTLLVDNFFIHGGVTYRTEAVRATGGYDDAYATAEDYDLWLRLSESYDVVNLPGTLAWFNRLREDNLSTVHGDHQESVVLDLRTAAVKRYLPAATEASVHDLYFVGHGWPWKNAPLEAAQRRRLAEAAQTLIQLQDAFLQRRPIPAVSQAGIRTDVARRLMWIRFFLVRGGGAGRLARLHRPRWDRRAWLLNLPALLTRS